MIWFVRTRLTEYKGRLFRGAGLEGTNPYRTPPSLRIMVEFSKIFQTEFYQKDVVSYVELESS